MSAPFRPIWIPSRAPLRRDRATGLPEDAPQDQVIVLSYRLHNIYNAFENIFRNVAAVF
ncbi:MAG: hypothetical protein ACREXS_05355 [Gammaproteobacteria bacterium]